MEIRKIIHIDMDAFYASIEQRDYPEYQGRALVVGGSSKRGVVAAASYEARKYGIHSAMPTLTALNKFPGLIVVPPRFDVYKKVSRQIMDVFRTYTDLVEPLSLDEAFLDVTANKKDIQSATHIAREIKSGLKDLTGLTASAGVSINKFLAKVASDMDKPDGLYVIKPEQAEAFIENLPVDKFFGVGKVTAQKMWNLGIKKGLDLKQKSKADLISLFGKPGGFYFDICRGIDRRPVNPERIRKSYGKERTFEEDLVSLDEVLAAIEKITSLTCEGLRNAEIRGKTLTVKVKYNDFKQITRSRTYEHYINGEEEMQTQVKGIISEAYQQGSKIRLLGVTLSNLEQAPHAHRYDEDQLTFNF